MTKMKDVRLALTVLGVSLAWAALPAVTWAGLTKNHNETLLRDTAGKAK